MEFGKRHDTVDTTDFCPRQADLSFMLRTCCGLATEKSPTCYTDFLRGTGVMDFGLLYIVYEPKRKI